jgi:SsrA-binding protein|tara:strand:+ start:69642 stop:70088 length:447 start_codon:yes stop_codon:yes gene_type:complete
LKKQNILIKNRKAFYNYEITDKYLAGIILLGTEIKSVRESAVNISNAFCSIEGDNIFIKGMQIAEYLQGNINNHEPLRDRKLLLNKKEINQIKKKVFEKKFSVIPTKVFINKRGFAKVEIGLGKGKKEYDKRESIKKRDSDRKIKDKL